MGAEAKTLRDPHGQCTLSSSSRGRNPAPHAPRYILWQSVIGWPTPTGPRTRPEREDVASSGSHLINNARLCSTLVGPQHKCLSTNQMLPTGPVPNGCSTSIQRFSNVRPLSVLCPAAWSSAAEAFDKEQRKNNSGCLKPSCSLSSLVRQAVASPSPPTQPALASSFAVQAGLLTGSLDIQQSPSWPVAPAWFEFLQCPFHHTFLPSALSARTQVPLHA